MLCCCCGSHTQTPDPLRHRLCNIPVRHAEKRSRDVPCQSDKLLLTKMFILDIGPELFQGFQRTQSRGTHSDRVASVKLSRSHGLAVVGDPQLYGLWLVAPEQRLYEQRHTICKPA